ncbi:hypothetical protein E2C01_081152 [Portunus trituberculatus]|uniref:Uncharacterized protein n=1 Tax=Portunus trituberculatus TaxID=210409 RepID=A0A5B7IVV8_PORTR|nr:hypothetical protein [Portunus trituberculatus]
MCDSEDVAEMSAKMRGRMNMKTKMLWGQKEEARVRALLRHPAVVWQAARQAVFCVIITVGENNYLKSCNSRGDNNTTHATSSRRRR